MGKETPCSQYWKPEKELWVDQCNPERITKSRKSIGLQKTCETIQTNSTKQCDMRLFEPRQFSRENVGLSIQRLGVRVPCGERDTVFTKLEAGKRTLSWPMRSRKNHSEPQNYRSPKNLGKRSFKIYQQETKWHVSDRAPLAQSGECWTFNSTVWSSSPLWGKRNSFDKTGSRKI